MITIPFSYRHLLLAAIYALVLLNLPGCGRVAPKTDVELVKLAKEHRAAGNLPSAQIELKNALLKNPKNMEARWLLGEVYAEQGFGSEAEKELALAREAGVSEEALKNGLGRALLAQGRYDRIVKEIVITEATTPFNAARLLEIRGWAFLGLNQLKEGCKLFSESLEKDPDYPEAYFAVSRCAALQQDVAGARDTLQRGLKAAPRSLVLWTGLGDVERDTERYAEADVAYGKALEINPRYLQALFGRATERIQAGKLDAAQKDVDAAAKLAPRHPAVSHLIGVLRFHRGQYQEAKASFEVTLRQNKAYLPAIMWLGLTNLRLNNLEQASRLFANYLELAPRSAQARSLLALAQAQQGDNRKAQENAKALGGLDIRDVSVLANLGRAHMFMGQGVAATAYLEQVVEQKPKDPESRLDLAFALMQKGELARAVEQLEQATQIAPGHASAEPALVRALIGNGEYDRALAEIAKMEARDPRNPEPHRLRGLVHLARKDNTAARKEFEKVLEMRPGDLPASHTLARLALQRKDFDAARGYYRKALERNQNDLPVYLALYSLEQEARKGEEANKLLDRMVAAFPSDPTVAQLVGTQQIRAGRPARALESTLLASRANPNHVGLLAVRGAAYDALADHTNAIATYQRLIQLDPESASAMYMLASSYRASRNFEAYGKALDAALKREPGHGPSKIALAQLYMSEKRYDDATRLARELQDDRSTALNGALIESEALMRRGKDAEALRVLQAFQAKDPKALPARALVVAKLLQAGQGEKAIQAAQEAVKAGGEAAPDALDLLGQAQLRSGDLKAALRTYEQLARVNTKLAWPYVRLATAQISVGDRPAAVQSLNQALALEPDLLDAQRMLASLALTERRYDDAIKIARTVQVQRPTSSMGMLMEGDALVYSKRYRESVPVFEKAVSLEKNAAGLVKLHGAMSLAGDVKGADTKLLEALKDSPRDNVSRLYLAEVYLQRGLTDQAIGQYEQVRKINPDEFNALNNLAWLYYQRGDARQAQVLGERALQVRPGDPSALDTLGWILLRSGNTRRGFELVRQAREQRPDLPSIRYHYAYGLAVTGAKDKAKVELNQLMTLPAGAAFPERDEASKFLSTL